MDNKSKEKMLLAALSNNVAERDNIIYKIQSLLDSSFDENRDDVGLLGKYFKELAIQELKIETMQVFYGRHFLNEEHPQKDIKKDNKNKTK